MFTNFGVVYPFVTLKNRGVPKSAVGCRLTGALCEETETLTEKAIGPTNPRGT